MPQRGDLVREQRIELRIVQPLDQLGVVGAALLARPEAHQPLVLKVKYAAERFAHADRPRYRCAVDLQHRFDLLEQRHRLAHLAVELVNERDDGRCAQPAYLQQLDGLRLHPLGGIYHHHRRVDRRQHAIGVLGKILVPRRIEQVDGVPGVIELHYRARDRNAALLLDLHPVGSRVARAFARLYRARELDRAAEQEQLLGERGLASIRVRNDGESTPARHVAHQTGGEGQGIHRVRLSMLEHCKLAAENKKPPAVLRRAARKKLIIPRLPGSCNAGTSPAAPYALCLRFAGLPAGNKLVH